MSIENKPSQADINFIAEQPTERKKIKETMAHMAEFIANAKKVLSGCLVIKPKEKITIISDKTSNPDMIKILQTAAEAQGTEINIFCLTKKTKRKQITDLFKNNDVIIDISEESGECDATQEMWDEDLENGRARFAYVPGLEPSLFKNGGALTEKAEDLQFRLNRMEAILQNAIGFRVTSSYGTDLIVPLRPFKERRWYKDSGLINKPRQWDNLPGGEIFTTPDEEKVNGVLVLPALDLSYADPQQGVDELVRLTIRDGVITQIQGGESAKKLRQDFEKSARDQIAEARKTKRNYQKKIERHPEKETDLTTEANVVIAAKYSPFNPFRIAEIGFGANSRARGIVVNLDQPYTHPATPIIEAEKRLGTMHLAFGDAKHGEEGTEGFYSATSHLDFVLPRNGLTVEMFTNENDLQKRKNGRKLISEGAVKFFE